MLTERQSASLRQMARSSGIFVATAKDIRDRLARGEDSARWMRPVVRG